MCLIHFTKSYLMHFRGLNIEVKMLYFLIVLTRCILTISANIYYLVCISSSFLTFIIPFLKSQRIIKVKAITEISFYWEITDRWALFLFFFCPTLTKTNKRVKINFDLVKTIIWSFFATRFRKRNFYYKLK